MSWTACPEALSHSEGDASGRCRWCGRKVDAKARRPGMDAETKRRLAREQDPLTIEPDEGSYYEE